MSKQLIFWHATGYLAKAATAMFSGDKRKAEQKEWLDDACHKLKHNIEAATRLFNEMQNFKKTHRLGQQHSTLSPHNGTLIHPAIN